jgi:hypothetical protein
MEGDVIVFATQDGRTAGLRGASDTVAVSVGDAEDAMIGRDR